MVDENISFFIDDSSIEQENSVIDFNLDFELNQILNMEYIFKDEDNLCTKIIHYDINYTVKQLLLICEYYGIAKDLRITKCNKSDILNTLIIYENNIENLENVNKRKKLWYYMTELKNDKFMKKYVLWN
jgi:hypothetical protein